MWGDCRGEVVTAPRETSFDSMHDVFREFSQPPVTPVPLILRSGDVNEVSRLRQLAAKWREHFDNPTHSDLKFVVEDKIIHMHRTVLILQSEHFRTMFQASISVVAHLAPRGRRVQVKSSSIYSLPAAIGDCIR